MKSFQLRDQSASTRYSRALIERQKLSGREGENNNKKKVNLEFIG